LNDRIESYHKAFDDQQESLASFLRCMKQFDHAFCEAMAEGTDFTLALEVRGDQHKLIHSRVKTDRFDRPVEKSKKTLS